MTKVVNDFKESIFSLKHNRADAHWNSQRLRQYAGTCTSPNQTKIPAQRIKRKYKFLPLERKLFEIDS